ncbi:MAG: hypothetical protein LBR70_00110 [Lactobacillaceae bacterium]|jgi:hypothetical protein|nr:hypothetical protein [Lactobacillaceae bacterium]
MKKYIYFSILAVAAVIMPSKANALFPTFDFTAISESVSSNVNLVKQYKSIKDATKTASDISNTIGSAKKTISELGVDKAKEAKEAYEKAQKEADRLKGVKGEYEKRLKDVEAKKQLYDDAVAKKKEYEEAMGSYKSKIPSLGSNSGGNEYDLDYYEEEFEYGEYDYSDTPETTGSSVSNQNEPVSKTVDEPAKGPLSGSTVSGNANDTVIAKQRPNFRREFKVEDKAVVSVDGEVKEIDAVEEEVLAVSEEGNAVAAATAKTITATTPQAAAPAAAGSAASETSETSRAADAAAEASEKSEGFLDRAKKLFKGSEAPTRRQPFKKTSFYKNSEVMALADLVPSGKTFDGMVDGRFIASHELAVQCGMEGKDFANYELVDECLGERLAEMSSDNASAAAEGQKVYSVIVREQTVGTLAEIMRLGVESAQYEEEVVKPMQESLLNTENTRDDITSLTMTNKQTVYVINRLVFSSSLQLSLDALRQLGYFNLEDYENKKAAEAQAQE